MGSQTSPQPAAQTASVPPTSAAGLADQQADILVATGKPAELVRARDLLPQLDLHQEVPSFTNTTTGVNNSPTIIKRARGAKFGRGYG